MNQEWLKLIAKGIGIPAVLSFFAYAYVIGYFLASDLAWFSFFSLSEHVVFAFRALPLAVGASAIFVGLYPRYRDHRWLFWSWIALLCVIAVLSFLSNHFVMSIIVFVMLIIAFERRNKTTEQDKLFNWIYMTVCLMIISIIAGFVSAMTWVGEVMFHLPLTPWAIVELEDPITGHQSVIAGHVMFAGESRILFYESGVGTHLLRSEDIKHIDECRHYRLMDHSACMGPLGTAEEAKAMRVRAIGALRADQATALTQFNDKDNKQFHDRDLHVFCYNVFDGKLTAHTNQALIGTDIRAIRDDDDPLGRGLFDIAQGLQEGVVGTVDYNFSKPGTTENVSKTSVLTRVGGQVCGVSYYK
jgi:hypothetical protein